jgi:3-deoxy-D-manno-octulosonic-acid transferase
VRERSAWPFLYNFVALPCLEGALWAVSPFNGKAGRTRRGRGKTAAELLAAGPELAARRPRLLFHAASAGEFLQTSPLIEKFRRSFPRGALSTSFFSSSAERLAREFPHRDLAFYYPGDTRARVREVLSALQPDLILFSKYDVWPNLAWEASERRVKLAVVGATLHERSGRLSFGARSLFRTVYRALDFVGASTEEDASLLMSLRVDPDRIVVTGDMRYDQTHARAMAVSEDDPVLAPLKFPGRALVAGSTWPEDERVLIPAFAATKKKHPDLVLVLVPHEVRESQIKDVERMAGTLGLNTARFSRFEKEPGAVRDPAIAIVDRVGFLAKVYSLGIAAYVGGGFGRGVHNVMEPACFSLPVFIGPRWSGSREASLLLRRGAAFEVRNADGLANLLTDLLACEPWRTEAGGKAREVVETNLGATEKTYSELLKRFPSVFGREAREAM